MKRLICVGLLLFALLLSGCGSDSKMKDGFYTAEMSGFDFGWKEYLCIMVKNDTIIYAEFNAKDESGYIKAWDNNYMEAMKPVAGTYPNEYTREYVSQLIKGQSTDVDMVAGASQSGQNFLKLSAAVIEQARKGDSTTVVVE